MFTTGRIIVFARASGVSLDGHVMLSTEDVQHNWLDVRRNRMINMIFSFSLIEFLIVF